MTSTATLRFLLPVLAMTQLLTACSPESSSSKKVAPESGYSAASCLYKSDEGQNYSITLFMHDSFRSSDSQNFILKTHFDKELDQKKYVPVLGASIESIKQFIENNTDLNLYSVASDKGRCKPLAILNYAHQPDIIEYWNSVNSNSNGKSFVAGVYRHVRGEEPFTILREDANKYTLIHEYLHYVFDSHRIKNNGSKYAPEIVEDFKKSWNNIDYKCYYSCPSEEDQADLMKSLKKLKEDAQTYLTTFLLEEVTIESLLLEAIKKNQLTQTSQYDVVGANWYIESTAIKSLSILESVKGSIRSKISKINESEDIDTAQKYIEELDTLSKTVEAYKTKAQTESAKLQKTHGLTATDIPHKNCNHSSHVF